MPPHGTGLKQSGCAVPAHCEAVLAPVPLPQSERYAGCEPEGTAGKATTIFTTLSTEKKR